MTRLFNADHYVLSDFDLDRIFRKDIVPFLFGTRPSSSKFPTLILVGAQPGSGKSQAGNASIAESGQTVVRIIGDDLRRFHPAHTRLLRLHPSALPDATAQSSSAWVERSIEFAARNHLSVLVEGTFRDAKVTLNTARRFHRAGFRIEAHLVAVSPEISHVGIGKRFVDAEKRGEAAARFTPLAAHARAFDALPATIRALSANGSPVQRFVVRSRNGVLFSKERSRAHAIRGVLGIANREWSRMLSDSEFKTWIMQSAEVVSHLDAHHSDDLDAAMLTRQLEFDRRYLTMVRSARGGEVVVRGHVRAGGDVEPYTRSSPYR